MNCFLYDRDLRHEKVNWKIHGQYYLLKQHLTSTSCQFFRKKATQVHACTIFNTKGISIKVLKSSESFLPVLFEFVQKTETFTAFSDPNIIFKNVENVSRTVKLM